MKETEIKPQHETTTLPVPKSPQQPAPWSTPGTWTITTVNGLEINGYLPEWAEDDPSETGVPQELLSARLAEVDHRNFFEGQMMPIVPDGADGADGAAREEEAVFEGSIDCTPYAADPKSRVPVVNIQVYPGYWLYALDPTGVTEIAAKLRSQADLLDMKVRPALAAARADWTTHHPPRT